MPRLLKWFVSLALALLLVLVVVLLVITQLLDPNRFKPQIEALVAAQTRGQLNLDGPLAWSFYPTLGLATGALSFRLPEDAADAPLARLQSARLGVRLWPLLSGQVAADTLAFEGLVLNLVVDAEGRGNWTRILADSEHPVATEAGTETPAADGSAVALAIERILIDGASIRYAGPAAEAPWQLDDLVLDLGQVNLAGDPMTLRLRTTVHGPLFGTQAVPVVLQTGLRYDADDASLQLSGLTLEVANLMLSAELSLRLGEALEIRGPLRIPALDARRLAAALGQPLPAMTDARALSRVALEGQFSGPANSLLLNPLQITVDDTVFRGQAGISNLDSGHWRMELKGNALTLDRYRSPAAAADAPVPANAGEPTAVATAAEADLLPVDLLRAQHFSLRLGLDRLRSEGLDFDTVSLAVRGNAGLISVEHLRAQLGDGRLQLAASADVSREVPQLRLTAQLEQVRLGPLLAALAISEQFDGLANVQADLQTRGNTVTAWQRNLSGPLGLRLRDGLLKDISLEQYACQAIALVRKEKLTASWPADTAMAQAGLDFVFRNGVGVSQNLQGQTAQLRLRGDGAVSLPESRFDFRLGLILTGDLSGTDAACAINEQYRQLAWPVRCEGRWAGDDAKTRCGLDSSRMNSLLAEAAKQAARQQIERKAEEKLGDSLRGLLDRSRKE